MQATDDEIKAGLQAVMASLRSKIKSAVSNTPPYQIGDDIDFILANQALDVDTFKNGAKP